METGRKLDRLVAEKVMGITLAMTFGPDHPYIVEGTPGTVVVPRYSTDMNAAWLVIERVTRIPQSLAESERAANTRFAYWFERTPLWSMSAAEAATAICNAALVAVGEVQ